MAFFGLTWPFYVLLWQNINLIGLLSSFLAIIDPNSFGLVISNPVNIFHCLSCAWSFKQVAKLLLMKFDEFSSDSRILKLSFSALLVYNQLIKLFCPIFPFWIDSFFGWVLIFESLDRADKNWQKFQLVMTNTFNPFDQVFVTAWQSISNLDQIMKFAKKLLLYQD